MAVTTIKSTDSLEVESVRAGGVGTSLDGVEVRSVAAGSCLCSVGNPPGSAGVPPASLYLQTACHPRPLPCKAHQTRLYGVLFHRAGVCAGETPALPGGLCAGGTPALPGGVCAGETPALPGGLSSRAVMPPPRAWPKAALMAVTTIKSTDSLEVESVRAGGVGTSLDGVEVRSVAAGSCLCSVGNPPGSAGVPPASLYLQTACHPRPLPCKAHQTRLYGVLFHRAGLCAGETPALPGGLCAGETPALPGGLCAGETPALPGGLSSRAVMPPPREWPKAALMAVTTIKSTDSLEVESVRAGGVGTSLDGVEVRSVAAGSCLCSVGHPPGSAGVPPASLYLQTACHPRPLPCKAHQTRLYGVLFHRAGVCAGETPALPGGFCAGGTPALLGGFCAGGTPALPGGLSSRAVVPPPRAWPKAALMAVTTIKSTDSLEVESVRAGGVGRSLDGVEVRSVAAGSCLCSVGNPPGSAGVPPASLYLQTASHPRPLPCKAHQTRLYGVLFHRAGLCAGETPALPGGLSSRAVMPPPREWPKAALMAVTTIKSTYSLEVESVRAGGVGTSLDGVEVRSVAAGSCLCSVGNPPGSAGVPPASLYLQTACHPRPLPCKAHQTRLYGDLFPRAGLCAGGTPALPGGLCAGGTPALPGGVCAGGTPALPGGVYSSPRPTLGGSLSSILQRLSGPLAVLRGPSWKSFLSLGVLRGCPSWISYVSWLCSSATISRATSRARSGWPGGREMAATTGWPPPP